MKHLKLILALTIFALLFSSCEKKDDTVLKQETKSNTVTNLYAPVTTDYTVNPPSESGDFIKFSFASGKTVTDDTWDIAFRGTAILVNGGTKIGLTNELERTGKGAISLQSGTFDAIKVAPEDASFTQDAKDSYALPKGSGKGWYTYDRTTHVISAIAGKVIVVKTHDGKYAKMEILSYYKNQDTSLDYGYYTFNYVYNPNEGDKILE